MKSAFNKPAEYEPYYQILREEKIFETHRDIYVVAILLGFISQEKKKLEKVGGEAIKEHLFQNDMCLLDIVAVLGTGDIKILLNEKKESKMELFEEYAYKGMEILVNNIFVGQHTDIDRVLDYVLSFAPDASDEHIDFSDYFAEMANALDEEIK